MRTLRGASAGRSADPPRRSVSRRWLAALLLVIAAVLFGIGTSYEAAERSEQAGDPHAEREQILGVDATSPAVIGTGIALSLVAASVIVAFPRRLVAYGVAVFAAVFAVLDLAEAIHGLREGEPALGVLALIIAVLHGTAAAITYRIASEPASLDTSVAPGNLSR